MLEIIYILIALGVTILAHEFGHFAVAKFLGMKVENFSIGFGPKMAGFKKGETEYKISWLFMLGGYVKLSGENPEEVDKNDKREFLNQHPFRRILVAVAGVTLNFVFAVFLLWVVFIAGAETLKPVVGNVMEGYPAEEAGLKKGDVISEIDGKKIKYWDSITEALEKSGGREIKVKVKREGEVKTVVLTPVIEEAETILKEKKEKPFIGISPLVFLPVIDSFASGYPAEKSGLKKGDVIKKINNKRIKYWEDAVNIIRGSKGEKISITVERGGKTQFLKIKPRVEEAKDEAGNTVKRRVLGVNPKGNTVKERYGLIESGPRAVEKTVYFTALTAKAIYKMVTRKIEPDVAGPIGVMHITYKVAKTGIVNLLMLLAIININLVLVNLIPLLPFDGGLIVVFLTEWVIKRPVPLKVQAALIQIGWAALIMLLFLLTYKDIARIVQGGGP